MNSEALESESSNDSIHKPQWPKLTMNKSTKEAGPVRSASACEFSDPSSTQRIVDEVSFAHVAGRAQPQFLEFLTPTRKELDKP